jgi:sugar/nucleoside kinase (ribokinase family)
MDGEVDRVKGGNMARKYDIMAAGHLCFDVIPSFPDTGARQIGDLLRPGKLVHVDDAAMSTGGPVSNTGIGLKILGSQVVFTARVGADDFGRMTMERLRHSGNADGIRVMKGASSSYTVALAPPGIDRIFLHNPGTNDDFGPEDLKPSLIAQCRHFHFGYPPLMRRMYANEGRELQKIFQIAKDAGATTSCDMALPDPASHAGKAPWKKILTRILPYVDIFLPSVEEMLFMLEREVFLKLKEQHRGSDLLDVLKAEDYSRLAGKLLELGSKMTSLKAGRRGFYFRTQEQHTFKGLGAARPGNPANWSARELWCPAFLCRKVASATGSGDSAIAGFLHAYLKGLDLEPSLKIANCLGWQNIQVLDAISGIHDWKGTQADLRRNMPFEELALAKAPGWSWDKKFKLWHGPNDGKT